MTTAESKHLGTIAFDEGLGGGVVDAVVPFSGAALGVHVRIDFPERFNDTVVKDIDMTLDNVEFVDNLARQTIEEGLQKDSSSSAQLYKAWEKHKPIGRDDATADFLSQLTPAQIAIMPDGGRDQPVRVDMTYGFVNSPVTGKITVRFLEPTGPQLAPAPTGGY